MFTEFVTTYNQLSTLKNYKVKETADGTELLLALPGVPKEAVKLKVTSKKLHIALEEGKYDPALLSRKEWTFEHALVNCDCKAEMTNGLLKISLLKKDLLDKEVFVKID